MKNTTGYFEALWAYIWNIICQSGTYKLLRGIYDRISRSWRNSRIAGFFRQEHFSSNVLYCGFSGKILRLPISILEFIQTHLGVPLKKALDKSVIVRICNIYMQNFIALNLRFLGIAFLFAGIGTALGGIISGTAPWTIAAALSAIGAVLSLSDSSVVDWLSSSALVRLIINAFGIETNFAWYDKKSTKGSKRLLIAAAAGLLCGIAGGMEAPLIGAALIIAMPVGFLLLFKPEFGLFCLVFAAPLAPTMAMAGLSLITILALILRSIVRPDFKWKYDGLGFLIMVFLLIYFVAAITSFAMAKSLTIWIIYLVFISSYFLVVNLIKTKKQLNNLLTVFVFSGLLVCLYGIAQYVFGWDTAQAWMDEEMFTDIKMRIYSTLDNPNVLGEYILLVLPVAIGLMWTRKGVLQKVVYAGISGILFGALILTFSRGCWLGLMAAAVIFVTFTAGKLWGLGLLAIPILPAILPESIINRFTSIGDMQDSSTSYRVYIWMGTLAMIKDFWVSGIGMGSEAFTEVYPFYSYNGIVAPHSHNLFLQILVESGIGGIIVFLLIIFLFLKKLITGYQAGGKGHPLSTMITALAAGVCGFLLQGMFDNCFYNYRVLLVFWYTLGIAIACTQVLKSSKKEVNI